MNSNVTKEELDKRLKEIIRKYFDFYKATNLKIEVNAKRNPENFKIIISDYH